MMTTRYFYNKGAKRDESGGGGDFGRHRSSVNTSLKHETGFHVWIIRISILVAIVLLISFYYIPFPINLILFIISLFAFLVISFWAHIQTKRQSCAAQDSSTNSYPLSSNRLSAGDQSFVDVPLEPIAIAIDNGLKPQFNPRL